MPDLERRTAGLRCRDVLALLADYVDGELDAATKGQVEGHLRGCDICEKFGEEYAALVAHLRQGLQGTDTPPGLRARLGERMTRAWGAEDRAGGGRAP